MQPMVICCLAGCWFNQPILWLPDWKGNITNRQWPPTCPNCRISAPIYFNNPKTRWALDQRPGSYKVCFQFLSVTIYVTYNKRACKKKHLQWDTQTCLSTQTRKLCKTILQYTCPFLTSHIFSLAPRDIDVCNPGPSQPLEGLRERPPPAPGRDGLSNGG